MASILKYKMTGGSRLNLIRRQNIGSHGENSKQSEMTDAKVPDNKSDWKSIDIYLFSNGQQSSPPRKYHLVTDQLDWWKATLNYLAKAQYGSLHNMIDLYTIEGKKVENPMQLSHNAAYVAVAPPDYFVDAGYDKYLIKATRSWEKGQIRRVSNTAVIKSDEPQIGGKSNSDIKDYGSNNIKDIRDGSVTLKTIVASMVDNQPSIIVKPEATTDKHINNTNKLNPIRPNRTSVQRSAIVKNGNSLTSPPRSRKPSLKRKDSVKIITEKTRDRPSISDTNSKDPSKNKILHKPIQKRRDSLPEAVLTKVDEVVNEIKSSSSLKLVNHSMTLIKTAETENVEQDKEVISIPNLYKNALSEKPSIAVNLEIPSSLVSNHVNRQGAVHELFDENRKFYENYHDKKENEIDSQTAISLISKFNAYNMPLDEKSLFSPPVLSTVTEAENKVAIINKEGNVNLKLNIEIWSGPSEVKPILNTASKKESLIIVKPEKGSLVNIEAGHDKTINTIIANEMGANDKNCKVIVVKDTCVDNSGEDNTNHIFPINNDNSQFLIFLPVLKLNERCKRCECKEDHKSTNPLSHNPDDARHNNLQKTKSCQSIRSEKTEKIATHAEALSRNNSTEVKVEAHTIHDKNEVSLVKRKSVAIRETDVILPEALKPKEPVKYLEECANILVIPHEPDRSELIVLKKESTGILHKTATKHTQTEWCDVLWEARLQNDGHYSFHMPTLETLKYYKL